MRGVRIEMSSQPVGLFRELMGGTPLRSFEERVFDEMADAIQGRRFMTRTAPQPYPEADRAQTGHVLSHNRQTIRETGCLHLIYHSLFPKRLAFWVGNQS
jgi:hypothetical protein